MKSENKGSGQTNASFAAWADCFVLGNFAKYLHDID